MLIEIIYLNVNSVNIKSGHKRMQLDEWSEMIVLKGIKDPSENIHKAIDSR